MTLSRGGGGGGGTGGATTTTGGATTTGSGVGVGVGGGVGLRRFLHLRTLTSFFRPSTTLRFLTIRHLRLRFFFAVTAMPVASAAAAGT